MCDLGRLAQVRGDKASFATSRRDFLDDCCATRCIAADGDDVHAVTGEAEGDFFAEPGGCSRDECSKWLLVERGHGILVNSREW